MSEPVSQKADAEFDQFADRYDEAINEGLSASGEAKEYFAQGRINLVKKRLAELGVTPCSILDFGCGTGAATPFLRGLPGVKTIYGVDVSAKSIEVAARLNPFPEARFLRTKDFPSDLEVDVAYCNGVFHHIPLAERRSAVGFVGKALKPGGLFFLWENNPWNPGTRYVMKKIPFDRDAIPLSPMAGRRLLADNGFEILARDFAFYFPASLKFARALEPLLIKAPLGAQYCVLGRKI
jgi:SAM-dependent methyltransferase